jgi:eukaryotic-like serine/threonine-protein kinase
MRLLKPFLYFAAAAIVFVVATSVTIGYLLRDESTVTCPDVTGLDAEEARILAAQKGLSLLVTKYEKRKDVPYNRVLTQVPDAAIPVRSGRTISVIVSDGPRTTDIPSYVGLSLEQAQAALQEKGVAIKKIIYVPSEAVGIVLAQVPGSGQNILDEEGMALIVGGREKRFFVMPDIGSNEYATAVEEMDKKQIKYSVTPSGPLDWIKRTPPLSIPPRTVFSDDEVLEIRTGVGG